MCFYQKYFNNQVLCWWVYTFATYNCSSGILKGADSVMTLWQMHAIIKCINSDKDLIYRVDIDLM